LTQKVTNNNSTTGSGELKHNKPPKRNKNLASSSPACSGGSYGQGYGGAGRYGNVEVVPPSTSPRSGPNYGQGYTATKLPKEKKDKKEKAYKEKKDKDGNIIKKVGEKTEKLGKWCALLMGEHRLLFHFD